jgi:acyl-CoA thioesterase FadM
VRRASVRFGYRIVRVLGEELLAVGHTEHCFLDREGKPARPPARMAELLTQAPRAAIEDAT